MNKLIDLLFETNHKLSNKYLNESKEKTNKHEIEQCIKKVEISAYVSELLYEVAKSLEEK